MNVGIELEKTKLPGGTDDPNQCFSFGQGGLALYVVDLAGLSLFWMAFSDRANTEESRSSKEINAASVFPSL